MPRELLVISVVVGIVGCGVSNEGLVPGAEGDGGTVLPFAAPPRGGTGGSAGGAGGSVDAGRGGAGGTAGSAGAGGSRTSPPPATAGQVECGAGRCSVEAQCCATTTGGSCLGSGGCPSNAVRRCDGAEDCKSGEVCCARAVATGL